MPVPRYLDGFDVTGAVGRMLDQPMLWWQAVGLFVAHFVDWEASWQESIGDDERERKAVHAIRSAAANVGAVHLVEAAGALENLLLKRLAAQGEEIPTALREALRECFRQTWRVADVAWRASERESEGRG